MISFSASLMICSSSVCLTCLLIVDASTRTSAATINNVQILIILMVYYFSFN